MSLGTHLKALRDARGLGLRKTAKAVDISPAYLSRLENDQVAPPSEKVLLSLAKELGENPDVLLAIAGRVSQRLQDIIVRRPQLFAQVIEFLADQPDHAVLRVVREVRDGKW